MGLPLALSPGTVIGGHYIIGALINSGGFGAVYRGVDTSEGNRACAIKEMYDVTPSARRQALMEASVLFTIRSKHLPEVYDALEANGRFYLIMQLIEGKNLLQLLQDRTGPGVAVGEQEPFQQSQGPCSEQEVCSWLLPIMDVLQELHSRNPAVIHRDIKPGNIILTPQQIAVLVDFGLTRLYDPDKDTQSMVRAVTEGFSPLEQYVSRTSPQSDIYSMAATMYLLLTNRRPPAAIGRSVNDSLIPPRQLNPLISTKMERALLKALAVQADQRYASMREFAQALQEPAFNAYADPTIAMAPPVSSLNTIQAPQQPTPASAINSANTVRTPQPTNVPQVAPATQGTNKQHTPPVHAYAGVSMQRPPTAPQAPQPRVVPPARNKRKAPRGAYPYTGGANPSYPFLPANPGGQMMAQPVAMPLGPIPSASGQGCLWGLLQGVLGALVVLSLKQEAGFYLAILMGFGFYVVAGFFTTRRGGSSLRGAGAGLWAGIVSAMVFWVALGVGLLIMVTQFLQKDPELAQRHGPAFIPRMLSRAWDAVLPTFPTQQIAPGQSTFSNLLILLGVGALLALSFGWIGGSLGKSFYKARVTNRLKP
ncbi:serine/threonine protein kinase [Ktedonosporobacter rubrisoli]|nr:serine/threonine-protein kinase [Ktedonosporobacter rubrisoli]